MTFAEYVADRVPGVTPAQFCVARLFDREALNYEGLLGGAWSLPPDAAAWRTVQVTAGRRSGKSLLAALHACWSCETIERRSIIGTEKFAYAIVSPDKAQSRQILDFCEAFGAERVNADQAVHNGVEIRVYAAKRGGAARGFSLVGATLDEAAFHMTIDGVLNLGDVHHSVTKALVAGATCFMISSPWGKIGYFYDLHEKNFGHPRTAVCARAPTRLMRAGDANIEQLIDLAYAEDPASAEIEFGASFDAASERCFFDGALIDQALTRGKPATLPIVVAGADLAQTNDSSALVILGDGPHGAAPLAIDVFTPSPGKPLRLTEVVPAFCATAASRGCFRIFADHWALEVARELATNGVSWLAIPGGNGGKLECFTRLREVLPDLAISPPHRILADQMRVCTSAPLPGGGIAIRSPRVKGAHGDVLSAAAAAASQLGSVRQYMSGPFNPAALETLLSGMIGGCEHRSIYGRWFS